jgi:hypothetical protein
MIDAQMRSGIDHQIVLLPKFILSPPNDRQGLPGAARFVADSRDHPVRAAGPVRDVFNFYEVNFLASSCGLDFPKRKALQFVLGNADLRHNAPPDPVTELHRYRSCVGKRTLVSTGVGMAVFVERVAI